MKQTKEQWATKLLMKDARLMSTGGVPRSLRLKAEAELKGSNKPKDKKKVQGK